MKPISKGGRILVDIKGEFLWTKWVNSCGNFWWILMDKNVHGNSSFGVNFCGPFFGDSFGPFPWIIVHTFLTIRSLSNPNVWLYDTELWKLQNRSNFTSGTPGHHKILKWKPGSNHDCQKRLPKTQQLVEFQTIVCSIFHSDESSGLFLSLHEFGSHQSTFETQTLFFSPFTFNVMK